MLSLLPLATVGWLSAATPMASAPTTVVGAAEVATAELSQRAISETTVDITIKDVNHKVTKTFRIGRDGAVDDATRQEIEVMFRCRRTEHQHSIDQGSLAMLADVASRYPGKTIELVSAYRRTDRRTSRHRQARAIDFRIAGVRMPEVRDYIWATHTQIGLGWYPEQNFIHMDHRPGNPDYAWTQVNGKERGGPSWSKRVRRNDVLRVPGSRVGA